MTTPVAAIVNELDAFVDDTTDCMELEFHEIVTAVGTSVVESGNVYPTLHWKVTFWPCTAFVTDALQTGIVSTKKKKNISQPYANFGTEYFL